MIEIVNHNSQTLPRNFPDAVFNDWATKNKIPARQSTIDKRSVTCSSNNFGVCCYKRKHLWNNSKIYIWSPIPLRRMSYSTADPRHIVKIYCGRRFREDVLWVEVKKIRLSFQPLDAAHRYRQETTIIGQVKVNIDFCNTSFIYHWLQSIIRCQSYSYSRCHIFSSPPLLAKKTNIYKFKNNFAVNFNPFIHIWNCKSFILECKIIGHKGPQWVLTVTLLKKGTRLLRIISSTFEASKTKVTEFLSCIV